MALSSSIEGSVRTPVTLQISLAPPDIDHVSYLLPHQMRQLGGQVEEVLFTVDLRRGPGRSAGEWKHSASRLVSFLEARLPEWPNARWAAIDYRGRQASHVASEFFGGGLVPAKDFRGGAFYSYFSALLEAQHDFVLHIDSDMMFGGGSTTWVSEATELLMSRDDVLACSPLAGPPSQDGRLVGEVVEGEKSTSLFTSRHIDFTTRVFLLDRRLLAARVGPFELRRHRPERRRVPRRVRIVDLMRERSYGRIFGNLLASHDYELPERLIERAMVCSDMCRIEFLGTGLGMWSLHPAERPPSFIKRLPVLVDRVESGAVTDGQRGFYDVVASMLE